MCVDLNVCKSMLLSGAYDDVGPAWNLVQIHEDKYVVDAVREPEELYPLESEKALRYQACDCGCGCLIAVIVTQLEGVATRPRAC